MKSKENFAALILAVSLSLSGCATMDVKEILAIEQVRFDPLRLVPMSEPNELRIDLIRQQTPASYLNDYITYQDVPYHPLGFDVGNGLYFDLNGNLSFRIDRLLYPVAAESFKIVREDLYSKGEDRESRKEFYTLRGDSLQKSYSYRKRSVILYRKTGPPDSLSFVERSQRDYSIVQRDSSWRYRGEKRVWDEIKKTGENVFLVEKQGGDITYRLERGRVELGKGYLLTLTNDNRTIVIARKHRYRNQTLYTIERDSDKILVYDENNRGKKIALGHQDLTLYVNGNLLVNYALNSPE